MRIILGIVLVTILVAAAWSIEPTTAKQRRGVVAIDPVGMMTTVTKLPTKQYDQF
jgi:hypothetical protein